jgi:phage shock protein C
MYQHKKLYRDEQNKVIGGVCKGIADYFDIDVTVIRAIFLLALILKGGGVLIYIVLMIVMPKKPWSFGPTGVDYTVPPQANAAGDPFVYQPQPAMPPRKSNTGIIAGALLIFFGAILLVDEFDILPDIDFEHLWPVPLVIIGLLLIFSSINKKPANSIPSQDPKPPIE